MCGRYVIASNDELSERFQLRQLHLDWAGTYNAAPSELLPVIVEDEGGERVLRLLRWGLVPRWQRPGSGRGIAPINARAESVLEKPMFRGLVAHRRCLVPSNGFYEWQVRDGRKQPYFACLRDEPLFAFAGLYDEPAPGSEDEPGSYTILTTYANPVMAPIHDRMPVILHEADEAEWLSRELTDPHPLERLFAPYPEAAMEVYPVSKAVNNVRNNGPDLIRPESAALR